MPLPGDGSTDHGLREPIAVCESLLDQRSFRVAQEALTNVTRHANARRVEVSLIRRPGVVSLRVSDDGRGVSTETAGAGIRGMRERAIFVGGTLTVGPGPDGGAEVRLDVPLDRGTR